jgi:hypothetical protein
MCHSMLFWENTAPSKKRVVIIGDHLEIALTLSSSNLVSFLHLAQYCESYAGSSEGALPPHQQFCLDQKWLGGSNLSPGSRLRSMVSHQGIRKKHENVTSMGQGVRWMRGGMSGSRPSMGHPCLEMKRYQKSVHGNDCKWRRA